MGLDITGSGVGFTRLTQDITGYSEQPVIASDGEGRCWVVWVNRLLLDKDVILASCYEESWSSPMSVTNIPGKYDSPSIACERNGRPMVVWVNSRDGKWVVEASMYNGMTFDEPVVVSEGFGKARNPVVVPGTQGGFWVAWESYANGKFGICLKNYSSGDWGETIFFSEDGGNIYSPALACDENGRVWVAYSQVEPGGTCVVLTYYEPDSGDKGERIRIASWLYPPSGIAHMNSYPTVCCDVQGRVWVAWQHNDEGQQIPCYFGLRAISAVCWDGSRLSHVKAFSPDYRGSIVFRRGEGTDYETKGSRVWERNNYYPTLLKGNDGKMYLFARNSLEKSKDRRVWDIKASALVPNAGWTRPASVLLEEVLQGNTGFMGRCSRPAVAIVDDKFMWVAWQGDSHLTDPTFGKEVESDIYVAKVSLDLIGSSEVSQEADMGLKLEKYVAPPRPMGERTEVSAMKVSINERRKIGHGYREYTLLWGNLHDHTLISHCRPDSPDGTHDDKYRYGMDIQGYDFVALTDHGMFLYEARWRETRRAAEFYNEPPYFITLPAFEWSLSGPDLPAGSGHRNIFFESDEDASRFLWNNLWVCHSRLPMSDRFDKVCSLLREKQLNVVVCPNHPANRDHPTDWSFHDPEFESVVEIYQSGGSAEYEGCPRQTPAPTKHNGCYVRDALERGYRLGFVASGDHHSMGIGITALFVKDISRSGIIEALKSRRCYATTGARIFVDFRIDGHFMGEEFATSGKPRIVGFVEAIKPLNNLVVFRNDTVVFEKKHIRSLLITIDFVDESFSEDSYYYLRVIQEDGEIAWSSPIWVNRLG